MAVVYPISEFPIDLLDVAVILESFRNSAKIRLQADETHSFCSLRGSDCFVALANVSVFAFATSGLCFGGKWNDVRIPRQTGLRFATDAPPYSRTFWIL